MFDYGVELGIDRVRVALINVTHYILYGFGELVQVVQVPSNPQKVRLNLYLS